MKTCDKCATENNDDSKFCSNCGESMPDIDETKRFCSTCGSEVPLGSNFCISCGAEVSTGKGAIRPDRTQAKARKKRVSITNPKRRKNGALALLISVPLLSILFFQIMQNEDSTMPRVDLNAVPGMSAPRGNQPAVDSDAMAPVMQKLEELNERIDNDPNDFHAYLELGGMYATIGRYEEASEYFESYVELQPDDGRVKIALAEMYANAGNTEKAKFHLEEALKLDPNDEFALYNLGIILASTGDKNGARKVWEQLAEENPDSEIGISAKENLDNL